MKSQTKKFRSFSFFLLTFGYRIIIISQVSPCVYYIFLYLTYKNISYIYIYIFLANISLFFLPTYLSIFLSLSLSLSPFLSPLKVYILRNWRTKVVEISREMAK